MMTVLQAVDKDRPRNMEDIALMAAKVGEEMNRIGSECSPAPRSIRTFLKKEYPKSQQELETISAKVQDRAERVIKENPDNSDLDIEELIEDDLDTCKNRTVFDNTMFYYTSFADSTVQIVFKCIVRFLTAMSPFAMITVERSILTNPTISLENSAVARFQDPSEVVQHTTSQSGALLLVKYATIILQIFLVHNEIQLEFSVSICCRGSQVHGLKAGDTENMGTSEEQGKSALLKCPHRGKDFQYTTNDRAR
jgi:hypothetical protein